MSEPRTDYTDAIRGVLSELISAQSALNMEASPIPEAELPEHVKTAPYKFLADTDEWAKHAYQHICAATEMLANLANNGIVVINALRLQALEAQKGEADANLRAARIEKNVEASAKFRIQSETLGIEIETFKARYKGELAKRQPLEKPVVMTVKGIS